MNKADIAGRLAGRTGLGKAQAANAVEAMFAAIGEALAESEDVRVAGFRDVRGEEPSGTGRAQPAHRRGGVDTGLDGAVVQGGQSAPGRGERRIGRDGRR